jgi:hypothetical protein
VPSRSPNRPAPVIRTKHDPPRPDHIEPKVGMEFVLQRYTVKNRVVVERQKIKRVIRQGSQDHGQDQVWTIEYEVAGIDEYDRPATVKIMWWIMYDHYHSEWADARLVQDEAAKRGKPIHAQPGKVPPVGRID